MKTIRIRCKHQTRRHLKTLHIPLLKGCSLQWHSNSRLAPSWQLLTKGIILKKGLTTPFYWSSVNAYRFHRVFIWKRNHEVWSYQAQEIMNYEWFSLLKTNMNIKHVSGALSIKVFIITPCQRDYMNSNLFKLADISKLQVFPVNLRHRLKNYNIHLWQKRITLCWFFKIIISWVIRFG